MSNQTGFQNDSYSVFAVCDNCGYRGTVSRPKGSKMPEWDKCPNCKCLTFIVQKYFGK